MGRLNSFKEFINEGKDDLTRDELINNNSVQELMDKFGISEEEATQVDEWIDEMLSMDDIDERMDFVEGLTIEFLIEDQDKAEEVSTYIKDLCIG